MSDQPRRELSDARTMRALAHPLRLALLDAMRAEGEITASRAAELLGDSPGNMSWHLQTLAKYGFVEETGTGRGRSRPWRLVERTVSFDSTQAESPDAAAAGEELESMIINAGFEQLQVWRRTRAAQPPEWGSASFLNSSVSYLTASELKSVSDELEEIFTRYNGRTDPAQRPPEARAVRLMAFGHPLPPPPE